jgi:hypothetical protein
MLRAARQYSHYLYVLFGLSICFYPCLVNDAWGGIYGPSSLVVSQGKIFMGERDGTIRIFDIEKGSIIYRFRVPSKAKVELINDNGRVLFESNGFPREMYEIRPDGNVVKVGEIAKGIIGNSVVGSDDEFIYYTGKSITKEGTKKKTFRLNWNFQNYQDGHFPEFPELTIHSQTEDDLNYWFLCPLKSDQFDRIKNGISLVKKTKSPAKETKFQLPEELDWTQAELATDRDSVWIILTDGRMKRRLVNFNKHNNTFSVTNYFGGEKLIRNLDIQNLPSWTYIVHQSHQLFPTSYDDVRQEKGITADFLLRQNGYRLIPNPDGIWRPGEVDNRAARRLKSTVPSVIKRVLTDYYYIRFDAAFTYEGNLWLVGTGNKDDGSIYHLVKAPIIGGKFEAFPISPTAGKRKKISAQVVSKATSNGSDSTVCSQARDLAKKGDKEAFAALIKIFENNKRKTELKCIAQALAETDIDQAVNSMIESLDDADSEVAAKAALFLGVVQDKRAVIPLQKVFQDQNSKIKCNAAYALGALKDQGSLPILLPGLKSEYAATRRCVVKALSYYDNPANCQRFYDMWLKDNDPFVGTEAGISFILGNCENEITRNNVKVFDNKYCEEDLQFIVDKVAEAVQKYPRDKQWARKIDLGINKDKFNANKPDESTMIKFNLMIAAMDWGESVDDFYSVRDWGSLEENKKHSLIEILGYRKKEELIKQVCPDIKFPDFSYWNTIIQGN